MGRMITLKEVKGGGCERCYCYADGYSSCNMKCSIDHYFVKVTDTEEILAYYNEQARGEQGIFG